MNHGWRGQGEPGPSVSVIDDVNPSHADHVAVADAQLLFTAEFRRVGPDLVLTGHDGRHLVIPSYFASEHRAALVAPNGASLSPDLIDLLVGSPTPGQYAQAQPGFASAPIGKVEKVVGNVTVVRNGVSVTLNVGDNVSKSDVIQTGVDSQVGIDFPDGTALNLLANTRMALSDFTYDENATSGNNALVSLVEGSFSFIAGKIAHTGQMRMETPVATLGIRGTTGWVAPIATITANVGEQAYTFAVVPDPGTDQTGQYDLIDRSGNVIAHVSAGLVATLTPSINAPPTLVGGTLSTASGGAGSANTRSAGAPTNTAR
jgi:FecR protein